MLCEALVKCFSFGLKRCLLAGLGGWCVALQQCCCRFVLPFCRAMVGDLSKRMGYFWVDDASFGSFVSSLSRHWHSFYSFKAPFTCFCFAIAFPFYPINCISGVFVANEGAKSQPFLQFMFSFSAATYTIGYSCSLHLSCLLPTLVQSSVSTGWGNPFFADRAALPLEHLALHRGC